MKFYIKTIIKTLFMFVLCNIMISITIIVPSKVDRREDLNEVLFGLPIPFISQDQSGIGYEGSFPIILSFSNDFLDTDIKTEYIKTNYIISVFILWVIILLISQMIKKLRKNLKVK